jgi:lysozyme
METLRNRLVRHEGLRLRLYRDSLGKATIGVGRCLETRGISEEEAFYLLDNDIEHCKEGVDQALPWIYSLDESRRDVLYEMAFQLGLNGLLGFKNTLAAIKAGRYADAAQGMLNSQWHHQTPSRCEEMADIMLKGE